MLLIFSVPMLLSYLYWALLNHSLIEWGKFSIDVSGWNANILIWFIPEMNLVDSLMHGPNEWLHLINQLEIKTFYSRKPHSVNTWNSVYGSLKLVLWTAMHGCKSCKRKQIKKKKKMRRKPAKAKMPKPYLISLYQIFKSCLFSFGDAELIMLSNEHLPWSGRHDPHHQCDTSHPLNISVLFCWNPQIIPC